MTNVVVYKCIPCLEKNNKDLYIILKLKYCSDYLDTNATCRHGDECNYVHAIFPAGFHADDVKIMEDHVTNTEGYSFKDKNIGNTTPEEDQWRLPFLVKLLDQRCELFTCEESTANIDDLIESLCAS